MLLRLQLRYCFYTPEITHFACSETLFRCTFLNKCFHDSKYCPAIPETVGLLVLHCNFMDFSLYNVDAKSYICPGRCASAANTTSSGFDVFIGSLVCKNDLLFCDTFGR